MHLDFATTEPYLWLYYLKGCFFVCLFVFLGGGHGGIVSVFCSNKAMLSNWQITFLSLLKACYVLFSYYNFPHKSCTVYPKAHICAD